MEYLLAWRMALAKDLLDRRELALAEIAERIGYGSAAQLQHGVQPLRRHAAEPVRAPLDGAPARTPAPRRHPSTDSWSRA